MAAADPQVPIRPARIAYSFFVLIITVYSLVLVVLLLFFNLDPATYQSLLGIDFLISLFFLADFGRQLHLASAKRAYLTSTGWLELLGSIPGLPVLRFARLARLVTIYQVLRRKSFRSLLADLRQDRAGAAFLFVALFGLLSLSLVSLLVLSLERNAAGANINNFADALWWAIVTTATVGYGDYYPVTIYGRLLSFVLMIFGIGVFGLLASSLANWFLSPQTPDQKPADKADIADLHGQLAELRKEIHELRARLDGQPRESSD